MIINNKEYKINTNCKMGIWKRYQRNPSDENMEAFVIEILLPHPSEEEYDEMGFDDIQEVIFEFAQKQKKKDTEFKKKLSL